MKSPRPALVASIVLPLVVLVLSAAYWRTDALPFEAEASLIAERGTPATENSATPTPTPTGTPSPTPSATATVTASATPTRTPSPSATATATDSPTPTATSTSTPRPTDTATATATPTATPLLPTPDGVVRHVRVPILMYHHIEDPPPNSSSLRRDLSVSPLRFERQLQYLVEAGYRSVSLNDLALHITVGYPLPQRPIILTFDDGYHDAYLNAYPLLQKFGFTATFFLVTAPIDEQNPDWLSWSQVEEMSAAGMRFEPHSYDHPDMRGRSFDFVVFQILAPKGAIEARTGEVCRFFAYPSGRYDDHVISVLESADFWGAVVTAQGATHTADSLFTLHRVRVQGDDNLDDFVRKLNLDW